MFTGAIGVLALAGGLGFGGQSGDAGEARAKIEGEFREEVRAAQIKRLGRLAEWAKGLPGDESSSAYVGLFQEAIGAGLVREAEPIAEEVIAKGKPDSPAHALAQVINLLAEAEKGDYEGSLKSLANVHVPKGSLPTEGIVSLLDLYLQDLIKAGRYDIAKRALELVKEKSTRPAVAEHAENWLHRIGLLGKPAPEIGGEDLDGRPVKLADYKGDVVLVSFWATWCSPCAEEALEIERLEEAFGPKGLKVLGVNLDLCAEGAEAKLARHRAKEFILEHNVTWPNVMCGPGAKDAAKTYGVAQLPANVLIDREGKVIALDLGPENIREAIAKAVGAGK